MTKVKTQNVKYLLGDIVKYEIKLNSHSEKFQVVDNDGFCLFFHTNISACKRFVKNVLISYNQFSKIKIQITYK